MIKITKLPDQLPDEKIYGCQIIIKKVLNLKNQMIY